MISRRFLARPLLAHLGAGLLLGCFLFTGVKGLDFGTHWDEQSLTNRVRWSIEHGGTLLPGTYDWPSVSYWLAVVSLAPDVAATAMSARSVSELGQQLMARLDDSSYRRRLRLVFLIVTSLAAIWLYAAVWIWSGQPWLALAGAAFLVGSWQIAYHARWPTPDGPLLQFVSLMLLGAVISRSRPASLLGPRLGAIASGLAVSTKYTAAPLALAWLASEAMYQSRNGQPAWRVIAQGAALAAAAFVITTPGVLLQPVLFLSSVAYLRAHYSPDATVLAPYLVGEGAPMLASSLSYLGAVLWSPWPAVAIGLSSVCILGVALLVRRDPTLAVLVAGGPALVLTGFALQPVLLVRNLVPLSALLAFAGTVGLQRIARTPWARDAVALTLAAVASGHMLFLWHAAASIGADRRDAALRVLAAEPEVCASHVLSDLASIAVPAIGLATCALTPGAILSSELASYPPPIFGRPRVIGALEVDALYYPTWTTSPHVIILK